MTSPDLNLAPAPERTSIVEHVTSELRRAILEGRLEPGALAPIAELSKQFGVSAIPVREALRALESDGLVTLRPNRKAIVTPISLEELEDVFRARRILEGELIVRSSRLYSPEDVERLETLLEELTAATDPAVQRERHTEFHRSLVRPGSSEFDLRLLEVMWSASDRYRRFLFSELSRTAVHDAHVPFIDAARRRSPRDMRRAFHAHLDQGLKTVADAVASTTSAAS